MDARFMCGALAVLSLLTACQSGETRKLRRENHALREELRGHAVSFQQEKAIRLLLDSIDYSLHATQTGSCTSVPNIITRLHTIHHAVKETEKKMTAMDKNLRASNNKLSGYLLMVDALKSELSLRLAEVENLEDSLQRVKARTLVTL